jgi:hypothetical protein
MGRCSRMTRVHPDERPVALASRNAQTPINRLVFRRLASAAALAGGAIAGWLYKRLWRAATGRPGAPSPSNESAGWSEVVLAAGVEGALYGVVKALVDRSLRTGVANATGSWPR